jgi:hypothetical protein
MAAKQFIITIPKPCTENWEAMAPGEKGKFCSACQKTVTDFSLLADREIIEYLKSHRTGNQCGRFHTSQLEREFKMQAKAYSPRILLQRMAAAFLFFHAASTSAWAQVKKTQQPQEQVGAEKQQPKLRSISGYVKDYITAEPLAHMLVQTDTGNIATTTDSLGYFFMQLPDSFRAEAVTITASYTPQSGPMPEGTAIPGLTLAISGQAPIGLATLYRYPEDRTDGGAVSAYKKPIIDRYGGFTVNDGSAPMKPNFSIYWPFSRKKKHKHE